MSPNPIDLEPTNELDLIEEPAPQKETTTVRERKDATKALAAAECASAPSQEEIEAADRPEPPPEVVIEPPEPTPAVVFVDEK